MRELTELIEQVVTGLGFELVTVEGSPHGKLLRVFIDIAQGITVDDCEAVSHQLTRVLEVENIDFARLEVSSPGLDRPLVKPADFERFAGADIRLRTRVPVGNQRNFTGVLKGLRDGAVTVDTEKGELLVAFDDVEKARLVPKF
ncbi:MAG: ribosome maturation factor RimP [Azoarcus sp.]|nr:ribosome maturation factor RimP [Azoarcus sp.]